MVGFVLESSSRFSAEQTEKQDKLFSGSICLTIFCGLFFEKSAKLAQKANLASLIEKIDFFSAIIRSGWHG